MSYSSFKGSIIAYLSKYLLTYFVSSYSHYSRHRNQKVHYPPLQHIVGRFLYQVQPHQSLLAGQAECFWE